MNKYIVLYMKGADAPEMDMENVNMEEMQGMMQAWEAWGAKCGDGMVDMGTPTGFATTVTPEGSSESNSLMGGFSVLQAEDMDGVLAMLEGHPHFMMPGATIEVHQYTPLPTPEEMAAMQG